MNTRIGLTTFAWMLALLTAASAPAQNIYKWTDANGQVHFSDQPPPGQAKADVVGNLPKAGSTKAPPAAQAPVETFREQQPEDVYPGTPEYDARDKAESERAMAEQERVRTAEARRNQEKAEARELQSKLADEALIARCKKNRDVYCDSGAEEIRRSELEREWHQYDRALDAQRARSLQPPGSRGERIRDPVRPSEPRPGPPESLYDKQKNKNKKK